MGYSFYRWHPWEDAEYRQATPQNDSNQKWLDVRISQRSMLGVMFAADIYKPDQWHDFFLLLGTGAATLTGLIFVALSLNVKSITKDDTHRFRAIGSLTGMIAIFVVSAIALMGNQNHKSLAIEIFVVATLAGSVYVYGYIRARGSGKSRSSLSVLRTLFGASLFIFQMVGAVMLLCGSISGLYIAGAGMVAGLSYMITGAWLLVVGAYQSEHS